MTGRRRTSPAPGVSGIVTALLVAAAPAAAAASPPRAATRAAALPPPALGVRAAALIEETTGQQLYGLNSEAELPIASTTKLMTALITLTHVPLGTMFSDPPEYFPPEDTQIYLRPGERMSVRDLLTALLLPSADDAAEDLAFNAGRGSVSRFLAMMNARAGALGLRHTHYTTPIGLDTPGNYSTAGDLVTLAAYLLRTEPFFRTVIAEPSAVLRTGSYVRTVVNLNDLVGRYAWINGVKTGRTADAGYVLVASATRNGMTLLASTLGCSSRAACDAAALALLDYGFANFRLLTPVRAGEVLARPRITGEPGRRARLIAKTTYSNVFPSSTRVRLRVKAPKQLMGPLARHTRAGSVLVLAGRRIVARIPLLLARAIASRPPPPV